MECLTSRGSSRNDCRLLHENDAVVIVDGHDPKPMGRAAGGQGSGATPPATAAGGRWRMQEAI
ncbi:hypothetical protein ACCC88_00370 [Sphingomonas sp. Sphisp140]|uniref:hypothetical protein n=1 Tax=Sphingomonas sp. Sphisp140 TaxID=3243019 RepID=UPI0039AF737B